MADIKWRFWQDITKRLVDRLDGTWAERVEAYSPVKLMTDGDGAYSRIRVDVGQTGFFAGREARTFYEFSVPTGSTQVIKVISPVNTFVQSFGATLDIAALRVELVVGGTEGGTFNTPLPIFKTNTTTEQSGYVPQITMSTGGTHTGGTLVDLLVLRSGTPAVQAREVSASDDLPGGFAAGTFYIRLVNVDGATATGVFRARWEERP